MDNVINIAIPGEWKKELENLARIYSADEGWTVTFHDLMMRAIKEKPNQACEADKSHCH